MAQTLNNTRTSLVFNVTRKAPELIPPARPTPFEFKELSDIDDQDGLRFQFPVIQFYRNKDEHSGGSTRTLIGKDDPSRVIKEAVAKALVSYYPFAGRLREKQGRKLVVECNGEGVMFIEGEADVSLEEFGDELQPPFPCLEELVFDVPGSTGILNTPLILIQVTRLRCGGFILTLRVNHTMTDALGLVQFMNTVAKLAHGAKSPIIEPAWERHLLSARDLPQVSCKHLEYEEVADTKGTTRIPLDDIVYKSFFFGPKEIMALRRFIPPNMESSTFDLLTACIWRCRTVALQPDPDEVVRLMCFVNARFRFGASLPKGYYGNACAFPAALSSAKDLSCNSIGYALNLVQKTKADVTLEYMTSLADLMVLKGRPHYTMVRSFLVSDLSRVGFGNVDFGWGPPAYGGPAKGGFGSIPEITSLYFASKNGKGEQGIVVPIALPNNAMDHFIEELNGLLSDVPTHPIHTSKSTFIFSSL